MALSERVAIYFHDDGRKCGECRFCHSWTEGHGERMAECEALTQGIPEECPALTETQDELEELSA